MFGMNAVLFFIYFLIKGQLNHKCGTHERETWLYTNPCPPLKNTGDMKSKEVSQRNFSLVSGPQYSRAYAQRRL